MRYELSNYEWSAIKPMLPNKPRGVRRVNDRRGGAGGQPDSDVRRQRRNAAAEQLVSYDLEPHGEERGFARLEP